MEINRLKKKGFMHLNVIQFSSTVYFEIRVKRQQLSEDILKK